MRLDFHGLITSDVAFWCGIFSTWRPSGNRVSKTRFINQKNFKKIWSLMYQPKYPKTNFRNPRNTTIPILETQIRGRERESSPHQRTAWVLLWVLIWWFLGVAWILLWWVLLWWVACGLGFFFFFFFFFLWVLLWSSGWVFIRVINQVLETRFSCGRHMEKMPHQTWLGRGNRVFDTQFLDQNRVL